MLSFDHVIMATRDVGAAAAQLFDDHGLAAVPGGRHEHLGTANWIVPLGPDYLELMYVDDPRVAADTAVGRWMLDQTADGDRLAALLLRVDDIESVTKRLGLASSEIERPGSDGTRLSWHVAGLERALDDRPLPGFVQPRIPPEHYPGRQPADHRVQPEGIAWVEFGVDPAELASWLGPHKLDIRVVETSVGVQRLAIASNQGTIILDGEAT
jgi:hypothetical protein